MSILTKKVLAENIAEQVGSKKAALELVNSVFEQITTSLENGETVDIAGFGKFEVKERAERTGRNPLTNETITIAAKKVPGFKASKTLKDTVNK
ncbi:MAG: HU family DNA-binding protein [Erysipelotrichaceae bacterium]